jgi:hypothetical protein
MTWQDILKYADKKYADKHIQHIMETMKEIRQKYILWEKGDRELMGEIKLDMYELKNYMDNTEYKDQWNFVRNFIQEG